MDGGGRAAEPQGADDPVPAKAVRELGDRGIDGATVLELGRQPAGAEAARPLEVAGGSSRRGGGDHTDGKPARDDNDRAAGRSGEGGSGDGASRGDGRADAGDATGSVVGSGSKTATVQAASGSVGLLAVLAALTILLAAIALIRRRQRDN